MMAETFVTIFVFGPVTNVLIQFLEYTCIIHTTFLKLYTHKKIILSQMQQFQNHWYNVDYYRKIDKTLCIAYCPCLDIFLEKKYSSINRFITETNYF